MYSVNEIACFIEKRPRTVRYYIEQGYLKATLIDNDYRINSKDFTNFKKKYFYSKRLSNRANGKILNLEHYRLIVELIELVRSGASLDELVRRFPSHCFSIPSLEHYEIYKRNIKIIEKSKQGITQRELALEFNLSEPAIQKIVSKSEYMGEYD